MFTERDSRRLTETRLKQSWPKGKAFKILSLDGGGIRGIFAATAVREIANQLPTGAKLSNYFDLIAGTSTGGIIGIGLGLGLSPDRISDLYSKGGEEIFPPIWTRNRVLRIGRRLCTSLYNYNALERLLKTEFKLGLIGDSETRLVVPAFAGPRAQVTVFKTDHHADYKYDWKTPAWEVARATSAAPTFFEGHRYGGSYFLDGGVWANNPVMLAIVEAVSSYDLGLDQIKVLSIGTGNLVPRLSQTAIRTGLLGWRNIMSTAMYLTTDTALSQARLLLGAKSIVRLEPSPVGAAIDLDDWLKAVAILPGEAEEMVSANLPDILPFLATSVAQRERHQGA